jgi:purine catabolism regulator
MVYSDILNAIHGQFIYEGSAMPTLDGLSHALGPDLTPHSPPRLFLGREVTGVHVSELADPTPYLAGGELLLTTGMPLGTNAGSVRAYVGRVARHRCAGLGLGLGPVLDTVPRRIIDACAAEGLPLFSVPAPTPFLVIARAYWEQLATAGQSELRASLGAHRDLVRAASQRDPEAAVVRALAGSVDGWAARLDADGVAIDVWPAVRRAVVADLAPYVEQLRGAGPHSASTFPLGRDDVVLQPMARGSRVVGFVATGSPRPMRRAERDLILAACALLAAQLDETREESVRAAAHRSDVLALALSGHGAAASALSERGDGAPLASLGRLIVIRDGGPAATELTDRWESPGSARDPRHVTAEADHIWAYAGLRSSAELVARLRSGALDTDRARVAVGPIGPHALLPQMCADLRVAVARAYPGVIVEPTPDGPGSTRAQAQMEALSAYSRAPLLPVVVEYLRHQGRWERVAAALGVHRNTVRQRMATVQRVAGVDLDDADEAAHLWLALRARGLA